MNKAIQIFASQHPKYKVTCANCKEDSFVDTMELLSCKTEYKFECPQCHAVTVFDNVDEIIKQIEDKYTFESVPNPDN